jgi:hypothetical protein
MPAGGGGFHQLERAVQKGHVAIGRDDVGAVGPDGHPVLDLEDLHAGVAPDEVAEDALVVRRQVLHQHKGHARIGVGGHAGEEGLERRQPPGGGADADAGKSPVIVPGGRLHRFRSRRDFQLLRFTPNCGHILCITPKRSGIGLPACHSARDIDVATPPPGRSHRESLINSFLINRQSSESQSPMLCSSRQEGYRSHPGWPSRGKTRPKK